MDKLLQLASRAGRILLESGAETYRVEETMTRICEAYHVDDVNSFVLPTGIFLSFIANTKTHSVVVRVKSRYVDLYKVELINSLSRDVSQQNLTLEELEKRLCVIAKGERYSWQTELLFAAIGAGGFAFFFRGSVTDALMASFCGLCLKSLLIFLDRNQMSSFMDNIFGGALVTYLALIMKNSGLAISLDTVVISAIMLLVPGIAITNAVRDSLSGDLVSGMTRALEAFLIAVSIALGTGAALSSWLWLFGGI